jgi:hypothetical protein
VEETEQEEKRGDMREEGRREKKGEDKPAGRFCFRERGVNRREPNAWSVSF